MKKLFIFFSIICISGIANVDYKKVVENIEGNDYEDALKMFDEIPDSKKNYEYWYFYGCLWQKILYYNILSDDVEQYFDKVMDSYKNVFQFNNKRYNNYSSQNLVALYNMFMQRGIAYFKINLFDNAFECFDYAKKIYENEIDPRIKIAFLRHKQNDFSEVLSCTENFNDYMKNDINCNYLLIDVLFKMQKYDEAVKIIGDILEKNGYDLFAIQYLYEIKKYYEFNMDQFLDKDTNENRFLESAFLFFDNQLEEAYYKLDMLNLKKKEFYLLFCDVIYKYCMQLQATKGDEKLFLHLAKRGIHLCKEIFYKDDSNKGNLKRLYYFYMAVGDVKSADRVVKFHKIQV